MSNNLPPGCTERDVSEAAQDCCLDCGAPCQGDQCKDCVRRDYEADNFEDR